MRSFTHARPSCLAYLAGFGWHTISVLLRTQNRQQPDGSLADHLAVALSARYARLVANWNGDMDDGFRRQLRALRLLCQDVGELRRGDHFAEHLRLEVKRLAELHKADGVRALETVLDETQSWPEVRQAFQNAFALYRQRKTGDPEATSK